MSFTEAAARLQEAVFRRLGEDAQWEGVDDPVRVIRREYDEQGRFDESVAIVTVRRIRVRRSEVRVPADGQAVQLLDAAGADIAGGAYVVDGEPEIDRKGVWSCPVKLTA